MTNIMSSKVVLAKPWDGGASGSSNDHRKATPMDMHVGGRIKMRKSFLGMSNEALGREIQVDRQQVEKYMSGRTRIPVGRLHDIAIALNVAPGWFFDEFIGANVPLAHPTNTMVFMQHPASVDAANDFTSLTTPQKRAVREILDAFLAANQVVASRGNDVAN